MGFGETGAERIQLFQRLLVDEFLGDELTRQVGLTRKDQQVMRLFFCVYRVNRQEALFAGTTVPNDDGSEDLDGSQEDEFAGFCLHGVFFLRSRPSTVVGRGFFVCEHDVG